MVQRGTAYRARRTHRGAVRLPLWLIAAAAAAVLAVAAMSAWRSLASREPSGTVRIDAAKLREDVRQNGMGHGRR